MASNQKGWYAVYTKPRWEKKVYETLEKQGIESYCPLTKTRKKWSDRYKIVEEPLFKSYVFVRLDEAGKSAIRYVNGVVNFVYWLGKPAMLKDFEILRIKKFLNEYADVHLEQISEPQVGDQVIITSGLFMEQEGKIISRNKKRVEILIESLGCKLVATVDKEKVSFKK